MASGTKSKRKTNLAVPKRVPEQRSSNPMPGYRLAIIRRRSALHVIVRGRIRRRSLRFLRNLLLRAAVRSGFLKSTQAADRGASKLRTHLRSIRLQTSLRRGVFSRGKNIKSLGFEVVGSDPAFDKTIVRLLRYSLKRGGPFYDGRSPDDRAESDVVFTDQEAAEDFENANDDQSDVVVTDEEAAEDWASSASTNPDEWYVPPEGGVVWGEGPLGTSDYSFTLEETGDTIVGDPANIDSVESQDWVTNALVDLGSVAVLGEEAAAAAASFAADAILDWLFE